MEQSKRSRKWIKIFALAVLAAFLAYLTYVDVVLLDIDWGRWITNRRNVQERVYESISMLFITLKLLVLSVSLLLLTGLGLIRACRPTMPPGKITLYLRRNGYRLATVLAVFFVVFKTICQIDMYSIRHAVETSEVPAILREHYRSGWFGLAAEITVLCLVISLVSGIKGRKTKKTYCQDHENEYQRH